MWVFRFYLDLFSIVFIDEILILSYNMSDHEHYLRIVLHILRDQ